ncbi:unnamed protein product [Rhizoctonia solani]|uniref:Uncharacterized protein n=1 Tax=Rhizoctonia solani TaxID=456999 RepID=A0A8H3ATG8_9AGAM|nr:unnamed protein product [Rhizoctonia solani]
MGNHSDNSHANTHPRWGRSLAQYYSSVYDSGPNFLEQKKNLGIDNAVALRTRARNGIQKIRGLGERHDPLPPGHTKLIPLNTLESISKLILFPKALVNFSHPTLVGGCIKLMATVKESGKTSPFSYEYGYLCFRILTIAMGVCILDKSNLLNGAVSNMISEPLADPIMLLSKHVENVVQIQLHQEERGLIDYTYQTHRIDSLLGILELPSLLEILYDDRKAFSIALMHTNSLGLSGLMLLLGRCLANAKRATYSAVEMYCEVLWRYSNASAWDKLATQSLTNRYREEAKSTWKPTFIDLEDCVTILVASEIALAPHDHRIPGPFDISAVPVLMGFATPFIEPGSENFLPPFLDATMNCMWNAISSGRQSPEKLVDAVRDIFYHISKILSYAGRLFSFDNPVHKKVIAASFGKDLLELTAHMIMVITPRSGDSYFFGDAQNLFAKFSNLIPREDLQDTFADYFPQWLKYANYFFSCGSSFEFPKEDRGFFTEVRNDFGYFALLRICEMPSSLHNANTSVRMLQMRGENILRAAIDWLDERSESSHRQLCTGSS